MDQAFLKKFRKNVEKIVENLKKNYQNYRSFDERLKKS